MYHLHCVGPHTSESRADIGTEKTHKCQRR